MQLRDANDEMVLEAAINGNADAIITHNVRDFLPAAQGFAIEVLTPGSIDQRQVEVMSQSVIPVHMPDALLQNAAKLADRIGMFVEDWLVSLAAENIRYEHVADRFFRHPNNPDAARIMPDILSKTKDNPPMPGDELEP